MEKEIADAIERHNHSDFVWMSILVAMFVFVLALLLIPRVQAYRARKQVNLFKLRVLQLTNLQLPLPAVYSTVLSEIAVVMRGVQLHTPAGKALTCFGNFLLAEFHKSVSSPIATQSEPAMRIALHGLTSGVDDYLAAYRALLARDAMALGL